MELSNTYWQDRFQDELVKVRQAQMTNEDAQKSSS